MQQPPMQQSMVGNINMQQVPPPAVVATGFFTAPWWYYAIVIGIIIGLLVYLAPPTDTKVATPKKAAFVNRKSAPWWY
jgi:hypothetical protein